MPAPEDAAKSFSFLDTKRGNKIKYLDATHAWNPQQGHHVFFGTLMRPETQFLFLMIEM